MRDLLILGVGVHCAEMAEIVERINAAQPTWNLLGFITPDGARVGESRNGYPVLGSFDAIERYPDAYLTPDCEWPRASPAPRERLASLVDPSAFVSRTARLGAGCVIYPHCIIGLDVVVGDLVFCLGGSVINHDSRIADRVVIASGVQLAGAVRVEADCYLGQACTVREYARIGCRSLIGMGAVVLGDVPPESVMVGNPARFLRKNSKTLRR